MHLTVRERVIASRLIRRLENNEPYAKQIGLSGTLRKVESKHSVEHEEKKQRQII